MLRVLAVRAAQITHPTGDPSFSVLQAFPAAFSAEEASPFLMCDHFGPTPSTGLLPEDAFLVPWHPHRGQDLLTYIVAGSGRHADSMGNRAVFAAPGVQCLSAGSGIEHAEGGGTPRGELEEGFQLWVNVPSARKLDAPRYGTHGESELPVVPLGVGATARVLAGELLGARGPFATLANILIADVTLGPRAAASLAVARAHDAAFVYAYAGAGAACGAPLARGDTARLDAAAPGDARALALEAGADGLRALVFTGARLQQEIAWHGPFVMSSQAEIRATIDEYRRGTFLKVRAPWDYKSAAAGRAWAAKNATAPREL